MLVSHIGNEKMFVGDKLERVSLSEQLAYPYNCIGLIKFKDSSKNSFIGTGFLIASDLVLTVAHNIFSRSKQLPHVGVTFYPGINGIQESFEFPSGIKMKSYRLCQEYKTLSARGSRMYDYSLLKLEQEVKRQRYLQLELNFQSKKNETLSIFGYNGPSVNAYSTEAIQVGMKKKVDDFTREQFFITHKISTQGGNSGSPVLAFRNDQHCVLAIHVGNDLQNNVGRLISDDVAYNIWQWEYQMRQSSISLRKGKESLKREDFLKKYEDNSKSHLKLLIPLLPNNQTWKLKWDSASPYSCKFIIQNNMVKKKVNDVERYQILSEALPIKSQLETGIRIISYGEGKKQGIFIGLITEKRWNLQQSQGINDNTCALFTLAKDIGNIYINGGAVVEWTDQWFVPEGSVVELKIDLTRGVVIFTNSFSKASQKVQLPNEFRYLKLYLFVSALNVNTSVEIV